MKRATAVLLLALALLLAVAFLLRREPREETPRRPPKPAPVVEAPPRPEPVVAVPERPRPPAPPPPVRRPDPVLLEVPAPVAPITAPGIVRGTVRILGAAPPRMKARMTADPECAQLHPGGVVLRDDLVVDAAGGVQWAFIYVASGFNGAPPKPAAPQVILDQVGCRFVPHVLGIRVGQPLVILNNDPLLHNVHALATKNREFNVGLPAGNHHETRRFSDPEIMVPLKCDIHPWMKAWVGVLDHPYFSVSDDKGSFGIQDLPPGRYVIRVWHERYESVSREIELLPGGDVYLEIVLDAKRP